MTASKLRRILEIAEADPSMVGGTLKAFEPLFIEAANRLDELEAEVARLKVLIHRLGYRMAVQAYCCDHTTMETDCPFCRDTEVYEAYLAAFPERRPAPLEGNRVALKDIRHTQPEQSSCHLDIP